MRCDAHVHFWANNPHLPFTPADLVAETEGCQISSAIFVECSLVVPSGRDEATKLVEETRYAAEAAGALEARGGLAVAIVAATDLRLGSALDDVLNAHEEAGRGRFRGVRARIAHDPTDSFVGAAPAGQHLPPIDDEAFRSGVRALGRRHLTLDFWLFHPQLDDVRAVARACEETTIVIDHLGGPLLGGRWADHVDEVGTTWRAAMRGLAECPNVVVKLGGIGMHSFGREWVRTAPPSPEEVAGSMADWLLFCIDTFGPSRCMFESNYPIDRPALPYATIWEAFALTAQGYTDEERQLLFRGTAERVYRLH
jgi:predicted TIM-barrel fold metal-dependent hydrolase